MIQTISKGAPKTSFSCPDFSELWIKLAAVRRHEDAVAYEQLILTLLFLRGMSELDPMVPESCADAAFVRDTARWSDLLKAVQLADDTSSLRSRFTKVLMQLPDSLRPAIREAEVDESVLRDAVLIVDTIRPDFGMTLSVMLANAFSYCMQQFALLKDRSSGALVTPNSISKLLVALAVPRAGSVFDPCAGSGGLLVDSWNHALLKFGGRGPQVFGQESNPSAWRAAKMNLILRGIPHDIGHHHDDVFRCDQHAELKADCILADPPFNVDHWMPNSPSEQEWPFGTPPTTNSNFAWIQHIIQHLSATGTACFTMSNASLSSLTCGEGEIRRKIVDAGLLECIVALPARLFPVSRISASIWILNKNNSRKEVLFIDAQHLGAPVSRSQRELSTKEINKISCSYHAWCEGTKSAFHDIPGFCRSVAHAELAKNKFLLNPSRYVGIEAPVREVINLPKVESLMQKFNEQLAESRKLDVAIKERMELLVRV